MSRKTLWNRQIEPFVLPEPMHPMEARQLRRLALESSILVMGALMGIIMCGMGG